MDYYTWLAHCRAYSDYLYSYDVVSDLPQRFEQSYRLGETVQDAVEEAGSKYCLQRLDEISIFKIPCPLTREQLDARNSEA